MGGLWFFLIATDGVYLLVGEAFLCVESEWPVWPSGYVSPCLVYVLVWSRRVYEYVAV